MPRSSAKRDESQEMKRLAADRYQLAEKRRQEEHGEGTARGRVMKGGSLGRPMKRWRDGVVRGRGGGRGKEMRSGFLEPRQAAAAADVWRRKVVLAP